jgi:hypothetical protein
MGWILKILQKIFTRTPKKIPKKPDAAKKGADEAGDAAKKRSSCTGSCNKTPEDITKDAKPGRKTKGKTELYEKDGGAAQMNKDFDAMSPSNVKTVQTPKGDLRTGTLPDGRVVTSRPFSSDGRPTLEIRNPANQRGIEIRYD